MPWWAHMPPMSTIEPPSPCSMVAGGPPGVEMADVLEDASRGVPGGMVPALFYFDDVLELGAADCMVELRRLELDADHVVPRGAVERNRDLFTNRLERSHE